MTIRLLGTIFSPASFGGFLFCFNFFSFLQCECAVLILWERKKVWQNTSFYPLYSPLLLLGDFVPFHRTGFSLDTENGWLENFISYSFFRFFFFFICQTLRHRSYLTFFLISLRVLCTCYFFSIVVTSCEPKVNDTFWHKNI